MKQPVRTLIFHPALAPYRIDLFSALAERLDLKVIFLQRNLQSQKFNQERLGGMLKCDRSYLNWGFNVRDRQIRLGVWRAIRRFRPDVVVCTEFAPVSLAVAAAKALSWAGRWGLVVLTSDTVQICEEAGPLRRLARSAVLWMTDGMVVYTEPVRAWYASRGLRADAIGICPNIKGEETFRNALRAACPAAMECVARYRLVGKRVVLFVGRLVEIKGVDRLIRAFALACRSADDAILVIVGDGPERQPLAELAAREGVGDKARFIGHVEGRPLLTWYLLGQLFVLPSRSETFGAVVNEALLAGMPVLCSSAAGAASLIVPGQNGHVCDPFDIPALAQAMVGYLSGVAPLGGDRIDLREGLMPITFESAVNGFIAAVERAADKGSGQQ